jgi:hypothetical protein
MKNNTVTAVIDGVYYKHVCQSCKGNKGDISSGVASFNRRRDWEDNAAETVQPYDASGPNPEFLRLYPDKAAKMFKPDVLEQLKRKI